MLSLLNSPSSTVELDRKGLVSELNLMRRVFESVVTGVTIADATAPDMPLIYVNPTFERMTGYARDEVVGRNCRFLQRGETPAAELKTLRLAIQEQSDVRVVLKNYTKLGVPFWNDLCLSPVFDDSGDLTHYVGIQNDITTRVELQRQLEHMALHDNLTRLSNRSVVMDRLQESMKRAWRLGRMTALLFLDIDDFKAINKKFGHDAGDQLLKTVGARLKMAVRESDCTARMGGDEFLLVASDLLEESEAEVLRLRLKARVEEPVILCGQRIVPRVSVGVSVYPRDGSSAQLMLKAADVSMYAEKQTGAMHRSLPGADVAAYS
jgi:diguanylate cyclase (GGDEF)-like protein/PAS domain S-box-containing protein